jgi:hypothetical protein
LLQKKVLEARQKMEQLGYDRNLSVFHLLLKQIANKAKQSILLD